MVVPPTEKVTDQRGHPFHRRIVDEKNFDKPDRNDEAIAAYQKRNIRSDVIVNPSGGELMLAAEERCIRPNNFVKYLKKHPMRPSSVEEKAFDKPARGNEAGAASEKHRTRLLDSIERRHPIRPGSVDEKALDKPARENQAGVASQKHCTRLLDNMDGRHPIRPSSVGNKALGPAPGDQAGAASEKNCSHNNIDGFTSLDSSKNNGSGMLKDGEAFIKDATRAFSSPVPACDDQYYPDETGRSIHQLLIHHDMELDSYKLPAGGKAEDGNFTLPGALYRELKHHQKEGLEWLWAVHCNQKGGILADDMGLGKTLQTTTFLSGLFHSNLIERVIIIVKPSLLKIWKDELIKADLERKIRVFENKDNSAIDSVLKNGGILLTTYETYSSNSDDLMAPSGQRWCYAVLDEAHKIKNPKTKLAVLIKKLDSRRRLLITGTPLQKDLMDLFSLMEFIDPDILGKDTIFHKKYVLPARQGRYTNTEKKDKDQHLNTLQRLRELIQPYMLRRGKEVLIANGDLPCKKNDIVVWLRLTPLQVNPSISYELLATLNFSWKTAIN